MSSIDLTQIPPALHRYRWARVRASDAAAWVALIDRVRAVDEGEDPATPELLVDELSIAGVDPEQNSWALWEADRMVGFALVTLASGPDQRGILRCSLNGVVDPAVRRQGIGTALMDLMEPRAAVLAAQRHPGVTAELAAGGRVDGHPVRQLLAARGYEISRYWHEMRVALPPAEGEPDLPQGYTIRTVCESDSEQLRQAHNAAFEDHWGSSPIDESHWGVFFSSANTRVQLSRVIEGPDGELAAYTLLSQYQPRTAYVEIVGTVRAARGRGLAKACLGAALLAAGEDGSYDAAELHVDSASPTGATRLYEILGFKVAHTVASYRKPVPVAST